VKTAVIRSSWIPGYGYRLDCQPYLGGALETKVLLEKLPFRKDELCQVTSAIYHAGRQARRWVDLPEYGVPFISSSDLQKADFSDMPFMSKRQIAENPLFIIKKGWSLITRTGTIGKMAYSRPDMDGMACSEHVLRVVPDTGKIPSGYLYAFLSSKFGVPLVVSGTYGSMIQSIEPEHVIGIPVPRLGDAVEHQIHILIEQAAELRGNATAQIQAARRKLLSECGNPPKLGSRLAGEVVSRTTSAEIGMTNRFDPWYFNAKAVAVDRWVRHHSWGFRELSEVANSFNTSPFKRVYVEDAVHGIGFFGSGDIFKLDREPQSYISRTSTKNIHEYILSRGTVLLASSGSLGGVIGRAQFVDSALAGKAASNHVMRIVSTSDEFPPGFLFAYLATQEIGYPLILRNATGDAIPEVWPVSISRLPILRAPRHLVKEIDAMIKQAFELRVVASNRERAAHRKLENALEETV
jgi:type I restriction enzyme S subunit